MSDYTGPGVYVLESVATKTVVNLAGSNKADGTKIIGYQRAGSANERWQIAHAGNDEYFVISAATGTYATAPSGDLNTDDVVRGTLSPPTSKNVRWKIVAAKTGHGGYVFHSLAFPGHVLNLRGSNAANSTDTIIYKDTPGGKNQEWLIKLP